MDSDCWLLIYPTADDLSLVSFLLIVPDQSMEGKMMTTTTTTTFLTSTLQRNHNKSLCCWGGTTLEELVKVAPKDRVILYDDEQYTVVNKPPDVRMDGDHHAVTIHKLLQLWYNPKEVTFRHAHQLDYATSGVLLFSKTTAAARAAGMAFELRRVEKHYTAVVHGQWQRQDSWECWTRQALKQALADTEMRFRKRTKNNQKWVGFQPPHSMFQMWQGQHQKKKRRNLNLLDETHWIEVWAPLSTLTERERNVLEMAQSWKSLKKETNIIQSFQQASAIYNQLKGPPVDTNRLEIPMFVSLQDDDDDVEHHDEKHVAAATDTSSSSFAVYLSVDESPAPEFRMTVPLDNPYVPVNKSSSCRGKPCLSVIRILSYNPHENTTTLRLEPWTGRRHQLRVHCASSGYPIVGDVNYGSNDFEKRLHLHSTKLNIPGIVNVECYSPGFGMTIPFSSAGPKSTSEQFTRSK